MTLKKFNNRLKKLLVEYSSVSAVNRVGNPYDDYNNPQANKTTLFTTVYKKAIATMWDDIENAIEKSHNFSDEKFAEYVISLFPLDDTGLNDTQQKNLITKIKNYYKTYDKPVEKHQSIEIYA